MNVKKETPPEISLSEIANYEYTKIKYSESIEHIYKDYYLFLPIIIIIDGNYYYQKGSLFILFSDLTFNALSEKLETISFNETAINRYAENNKYNIRKLDMIKEVIDYLNNNKSDL